MVKIALAALLAVWVAASVYTFIQDEHNLAVQRIAAQGSFR